MRGRILAAALMLAIAAACQSKSPEATGDGPRAKSTGTASEGAMCKEHGLLQAVCTKCNPKLIAVFQAKGDWCKQHEFPESLCPICHPERGGKPAKDVKSDKAPADGTKVRFATMETATLAGIEVVKATTRPGGAGVLAPAKLAYDATKLAHVNARAAGVVRSLKADAGTRVKKGDILAVIDSPEVGAQRAKLAAVRSQIAIAEENLKREQAMQAEGIASRKSVLSAQQELDSAKSDYGALAASLAVLGAGSGGAGGYTLTAPLDGVVTERRVTIGELVNSDEMLFEVVDISSMWADVEVAETDLPAVAVGQSVAIAIDGLDGRTFTGKITVIAPAVDPRTRTAKARVPLTNPDDALRANMFAQARIDVGAARAIVMVPRAAVQRAKNVPIVFVRLAEDTFELRRVELGLAEPDGIELKKGVRSGEEVVTQGSFLLKTETLKESIGAGCCEGD